MFEAKCLKGEPAILFCDNFLISDIMTSNFVALRPEFVVKLYSRHTKANRSKQCLATCSCHCIYLWLNLKNAIFWAIVIQKLYKPPDLFVGVALEFSCLLSSAGFVSCERKLGDRLPLFELEGLKSHISKLKWVPFPSNGCAFCPHGEKTD